jgi:hypothetical protein
LFAAAELPVEVTEPAKLTEEPVIAVLKSAPIRAIRPTGEEVEMAVVVTPPPAAVEVASAKTLPGTASPLPLIAMFGLLALGGALTLRLAEKRLQ